MRPQNMIITPIKPMQNITSTQPQIMSRELLQTINNRTNTQRRSNTNNQMHMITILNTARQHDKIR